jgi:hypothetical protein
MIVYGIKQPRVKNEKSIMRSAKKYGFDGGENYSLSPKGWIVGAVKSEPINDVLIYDKDGYRVLPLDTVTCSSQNTDLLGFYQDSTRVKKDSLDQWESYKKNIVHLDGTTAAFDDEYDYTVVLTWASFVGRLNKTMTKERSEYLKQNQPEGYNIRLLYINKDIRDYWPDSVKSKFSKSDKK